MKKLLERFKQEKKVISIYNDPSDTGNCWTGFVSEVDDNYVLIAHCTEHGFYGGFCLHEIEGIYNIEQDTSYEKKVQKLYQLRKQNHPTISLDVNNSLLDSLLAYVQKEEIFVSIELMEDDPYSPTGLIQELTEDYVCLKNFTSSGETNGYSYIEKEDIHKLFVDSMPEQDLALIYQDLNK